MMKQKKDEIIINYIDTIQFKNLNLDVYEKILIRIQSIDDKAYLFNNIIERNLFEISKNKVEINLLNITLKGGVDFNFLTRLNLKNDNYKINVTIIFFDKFESVSNDYLDQFDIVLLGGHDYMQQYTGFSQKSYKKVEAFRKRKGTLMLLHDIHAWQILSPFYHLFRFKYGPNDVPGLFTKIKFNLKSDKIDIISSPFLVGTEIDISKTHQSFSLKPNSDFAILCSTSDTQHYYIENLYECIAECSMCHTHEIKEQEQKLFYNIICHLYNQRNYLNGLKLL